MKHKLIRKRIFSFLFIFSFILAFSQDQINGDPNKGKDLFKQHCSACHALGKKMVGPDLDKVATRLQKEQNLGRDWLQKWIKNNEALRKSGDAYANKVFEANNKTAMTVFENLSEKDIDDILAYTENPPKDVVKSTNPVGNSNISVKKDDISSKMLFLPFVIISILLIWVALKLNQLVKYTINQNQITELQEQQIKSCADFYAKNTLLIKSLFFAFAIFSLYGVWAILFGIGIDKGYKPDQPIYFSHKIHAGINKIDCQLCHSSAKYGKVSGIPTLNTCMNCHKNISEYNGEYIEEGKSKEFYTAEIKKIYEHIGWDEANQTYSKPQKPIKWTRIHNMPDFVAFNHAQHVVAGEKAIIESHNAKNPNNQIDVVCKSCHGQIDTMNVVEMANDFTMGWCIECHRTTKVDMNNGYNAEYFKKLHEKVKKTHGEKAEVTVDAIGGMECGKCHY